MQKQQKQQVKATFIKRRTVVVRVERPGSGIVVCHARIFVNTYDIYRQLATQITFELNKPYSDRKDVLARPWGESDFDLFAGHNFDDKALLSPLPENDDQVRFQVCCLAFCNIPVVMCRKRSAVWVDVQVREGQKVRTVCNVRPVTREHILRACLPDLPQDYFNSDFVSHVNYKVTFDGAITPPDPPGAYGYYMCDASCSVVVEQVNF